MKFVLATFNRDKARELKALLGLKWVELLPLYEMSGASAPAETGQTLGENALLKARAAVGMTGMPAIADDTGLEVDALNGEPGIKAARYAGWGASASDNIALLLSRMGNVGAESRTARFRTVCVACFPDRDDLIAEGTLEGRITAAPRGTGGFGYDPVFELPDGRTLAELTGEEKGEFSHRARAVKLLAAKLADI